MVRCLGDGAGAVPFQPLMSRQGKWVICMRLRQTLYSTVSPNSLLQRTLPLELTTKVHHANLDRVWWSWQSFDLENRLHDISGPIFLMDYDNVQGGNVTLDFEMTVGVSAPNVTVGDVMNISGGAADGSICYTYDDLYALQA